MEVTNVEARWQRRLPREQYGHAEVELKFSAVLEGDDDPKLVADAMLEMLRASVSEKLGISVPASPETPAKEPAKKKAGRPKKEATPDTKTEDKPASKADEVPDVDEVPDDNIRANPEDRKNPEDDGIPDEDESPSKEDAIEFTAVELSKMFTKAVKEKRATVEQMKEILAGFKVSKTSELSSAQIMKAKEIFDNLFEVE